MIIRFRVSFKYAHFSSSPKIQKIKFAFLKCFQQEEPIHKSLERQTQAFFGIGHGKI